MDSHLRLGRIAHQIDAGHQEQLLGADEYQPDETHRRHLRQLLKTGYRGLPQLWAGRLADQKAAVAVDEHHGDDTQQDADQNGSDRVPDDLAGELVQPDPQRGEHDADQRRGVLGEHRAGGRIGRLQHMGEEISVVFLCLTA